MNCKKAKELILTGYADKELNEGLNLQVEAHLAGCGQCREFKDSLYKLAIEPLKNLKEIKPPGSVWENIKEGIETEPAGRPAFSIPRPVFAVALSVTVFVIGASVALKSLNSQARINNYFQEQEKFLNSLETNGGDYSAAGRIGTAIEEYFL